MEKEMAPLQYTWLENSMDKGGWCEVAKVLEIQL